MAVFVAGVILGLLLTFILAMWAAGSVMILAAIISVPATILRFFTQNR